MSLPLLTQQSGDADVQRRIDVPAQMHDLPEMASEPLADFLARIRAMSSGKAIPTTRHYSPSWSIYSHHYCDEGPLFAQRPRGPRSQGHPHAE